MEFRYRPLCQYRSKPEIGTIDMNMSPFNIVHRMARFVRHRFAHRALILMYHRVADLPSDPQMLAVRPQYFADHMAVLRRYATPLRLHELTTRLAERRLPRRGVVVTFDDGYADNLLSARPLLQRSDVPATVFVTTGRIGSDQEFWWDELDRLVLQPGELPASLELDLGAGYRWTLDQAANYSEQEYHQQRGWTIQRADDPSARQQLYRALYLLLHDIDYVERQRVLNTLRRWAGTTATGRASHRTLTAPEVTQLADGGLVEIGAHTINHPPLATLACDAQRREIVESKAQLETIIGRPVASFAYPHGSYSAATVGTLQEVGFDCACASDTDVVWYSASRFALPRLCVRDWDGDTFERWLKKWFGG
jgi:peptidoglycan/xylan/chitin deacetylase (PgdA/CDA1 family)